MQIEIIRQIKGKHRYRNYRVCKGYIEENLTSDELGGRFGISARQVRRILYKNKAVLKLDNDWEKTKRIAWLKRQIQKRGDSRKDAADLLEQLRTEIEGTKPLIDQSQHLHITTIQEAIASANSVADRRKAENLERPRVLETKSD